jgi:hypothetical protein
MSANTEYLNKRVKSLVDQRNMTNMFWQNAKEYMLPDHGRDLTGSSTTEVNDNSDTRDKILDMTTESAVGTLAAGLMTGATSQARPWFKLLPKNKALREDQAAMIWFDEVTELIRETFAGSNIYNAFHHYYLELAGFCTAAGLLQEDLDSVIRLDANTAGEYYLGINAKREVDTYLSVAWVTARQMEQKYGRDRLSDPVKSALNNQQTEQPFKVLNLIEPNESNGYEYKDPQGRPFRSVQFEEGTPDEKILSEGGYWEFPAIAPRWHVVSNNVYGTGPGRVVLGDAKMLQEITKLKLILTKKIVEPPMRGTSPADIIRTFPGGLSYPDNADGQDPIAPLYIPQATALQWIQAMTTETQSAVRSGMFNDLFLMITLADQTNMTATEVAERHEEKLTLLGPMFERMQGEMLSPCVSRTFAILNRRGELPPAPEILQGADIEIEYTSILAQAMKAIGVRPLEQLTQYIGALSATMPSVLDVFDVDKAAMFYADHIGAPPETVRDEDVIEGIREARLAQQEAQAQQEQMMTAAQGAKTMSEAQVGNDSVLDMLLGGVT